MAYWTRKNVAVYVYRRVDGKAKPLPRDLTRHLDAEPDHNIEAWLRNWELANECGGPPKDQLTHAETIRLVDQYAAYLKARGKSPNTAHWHRALLIDYVLPWFVHSDPETPDPNQWHGKSVRLLAHLEAKGLTESNILRANTALRGFWKWLGEENLILSTSDLRLRRPLVRAKPTPLQFTITPQDILAFVATSPNPSIRFMALMGYFCSLRPQETFALRPLDFRAGTPAAGLECGKTMEQWDLFSRLAVTVHRQQVQSGEFPAPKAYSVGWVSCFDSAAARALIELMRGRPKEDLVLPNRTDHWYDLWAAEGMKSVTLKDLRRASLYYLGHRVGMDLVALKAHARHARAETTELYLRRPGEDPGAWTELDLDA